LPVVVAGDGAGDGAEVGGDAVLVIGRSPTEVAAALTIATDRPDVEIVRAYHVLWELVQVALEHPGLVGDQPSAGGDTTGFLYPFLDAAEHDESGLGVDMNASAEAKRLESERVGADALERNGPAIQAAVAAMLAAIDGGGRILTMGNGGSATDAARLARQLRAIGVPVEPLAADYAVLTALANDIGVDQVFARQVEAFGRAGDVLIGCSTSGTSPNLLAAFERAASDGLTTIGLSGYGGESFANQSCIDHSLAVCSPSVHRIQEAQAALMTEMVERLAG
ncbi:MAG: D-sedoheptulose-7-phosphate isomerase, partial [Acidimicrobiales bacterium]